MRASLCDVVVGQKVKGSVSGQQITDKDRLAGSILHDDGRLAVPRHRKALQATPRPASRRSACRMRLRPSESPTLSGRFSVTLSTDRTLTLRPAPSASAERPQPPRPPGSVDLLGFSNSDPWGTRVSGQRIVRLGGIPTLPPRAGRARTGPTTRITLSPYAPPHPSARSATGGPTTRFTLSPRPSPPRGRAGPGGRVSRRRRRIGPSLRGGRIWRGRRGCSGGRVGSRRRLGTSWWRRRRGRRGFAR